MLIVGDRGTEPRMAKIFQRWRSPGLAFASTDGYADFVSV
jgi:hypothetical protein